MLIMLKWLNCPLHAQCPSLDFRFMKVDTISAHTTIIFHHFILKGGYKELPTAPSHIITSALKIENLEKAFNSRQTDTYIIALL